MSALSRRRRLAIALLSLVIAAPAFRPQMAAALVVRGDDFLYRNDPAEARVYYLRAMYVDPDDESAADRYAFFGVEMRTPQSLRQAIDVAGRYLRAHPHSAPLLEDRGLCEQVLRQYRSAERDFAGAAKLQNDPRYYTFAGWDALRSGQRVLAGVLFRAALRARRGYLPAVRGLRRAST